MPSPPRTRLRSGGRSGNTYARIARRTIPGSLRRARSRRSPPGALDGTSVAIVNRRQPSCLRATAIPPAMSCQPTQSGTRCEITPWIVTTFAGLPDTGGSSDGASGAARFLNPTGIAVDADGNVYVSDTGNHTVRKITAAGVVSTLAGTPGAAGNVEGTGGSARFNVLAGLTVDGDRNVYVVDSSSHVVRKITPAGAVSTIAGSAGNPGDANGPGVNSSIWIAARSIHRRTASWTAQRGRLAVATARLARPSSACGK